MVLVAQGDALSKSQRQSWIVAQGVSLIIVGWGSSFPACVLGFQRCAASALAKPPRTWGPRW